MNSSEYYKSSVCNLPYTYTFLGKDGAGRKKYARTLDGEFLGYLSLLNFSEWKEECKRVRKELGSSLQSPSRWTRSTKPDGTLYDLFSYED